MKKLDHAILRELLPREDDAFEAQPAAAATPRMPLDHWSPAVLLERGDYLRKLAQAGDGSSSETLKGYPGHAVMLSFRSRDGVAEVHERFADVFVVMDGRARLVTGGTVIGGVRTAEGEIRGMRIEGGQRQELRAGDVAHVPAGVPHQMLVSSEHTFTALVLKIEQPEAGEA